MCCATFLLLVCARFCVPPAGIFYHIFAVIERECDRESLEIPLKKHCNHKYLSLREPGGLQISLASGALFTAQQQRALLHSKCAVGGSHIQAALSVQGQCLPGKHRCSPSCGKEEYLSACRFPPACRKGHRIQSFGSIHRVFLTVHSLGCF